MCQHEHFFYSCFQAEHIYITYNILMYIWWPIVSATPTKKSLICPWKNKYSICTCWHLAIYRHCFNLPETQGLGTKEWSMKNKENEAAKLLHSRNRHKVFKLWFHHCATSLSKRFNNSYSI